VNNFLIDFKITWIIEDVITDDRTELLRGSCDVVDIFEYVYPVCHFQNYSRVYLHILLKKECKKVYLEPKTLFMTDHEIMFLTLILTGLAIAITIIIAVLQSKKKRLLYRIPVENKMLTTEEVKEGNIKILYKDQKVNEIALLILYIKNYGKIPIVKEDFDLPMQFNFSENCNVLSAEVIKTLPEKINVEVITNQNSIVIKPLLINPGDIIVFKILTSKLDDSLNVFSRIKGITSIAKRKESENRNAKFISLILIYIFVALIAVLYLFIPRDAQYFELSALIIFTLLFIATFVNFFLNYGFYSYVKDGENYKFS
jgi:hypothetical protein